MNKTLLFLLLLILSPFFWSNLFWPQKILGEYGRLPHYISTQKENLLSIQKIKPLDDMHWYSQNRQLGRLFFSKLYILPDQVFYGLKSISPHQIFTPSNERESVSFILLPFFIIGIYLSLIRRQAKYFVFLLFTAFIPIITGQPTVYFLIPTFVVYLLLIHQGLSTQKPKIQILSVIVLLLHNLLILGRFIIL